jgi:preprotein translocase subunit SecD
MDKPLSFKQFVILESELHDEENVQDEALDMQARRKLAISMRRNKAKVAMGRKRAERKVANLDKLKKRARKHARKGLLNKLTKDIPKSELSFARKKELEKRLEKPAMQRKIGNSARKMLPQVRKAELAKKRGGKSAD